jgi:protein gp37
MSVKSKIEWTESLGTQLQAAQKSVKVVKICYAERLAKRLQAMGQVNYSNGFAVNHPP